MSAQDDKRPLDLADEMDAALKGAVRGVAAVRGLILGTTDPFATTGAWVDAQEQKIRQQTPGDAGRVNQTRSAAQKLTPGVESAIQALHQLMKAGRPYTTQRALSEQLKISEGNINAAIKADAELQVWMHTAKRSVPDNIISLDKVPNEPAADLTPDEQAAANELAADPKQMEAKLQELIVQVKKQYSGDQRTTIIESLQHPPDDIDFAQLMLLTEDQLRHDRRQQVKPKTRR